MMDRIVVESEAVMFADPSAYRRRTANVRLSISETICESMAHAAEDLDIGAIAVFTETAPPRASSPSGVPSHPSSRSPACPRSSAA